MLSEQRKFQILNAVKEKGSINNNLNEEEINLNEEIMKMRIKLEQLRQKKKNLENENENLDLKINDLRAIIKRISDEDD